MASASYNRDCSPAVVVPRRGGDVAIVTCTHPGCKSSDEWQMQNRCPPERVHKTFIRRGWTLGRKPLCPEHSIIPKDKPMQKTPAISPNAVRAQVLMIQLLGDHFDVAKGAYTDGWTDQKIADKAGMSLQAVMTFRTEGFGPIKEPPEIAKLAREIEAFRSMVRDANDTVTLLQGELSSLEASLAELRKRYA